MSRRVLFLDIDGVLNSIAWFRSRGPWPKDPPRWRHDFDPDAVALLDEFVRAVDADIVLSSTWRLLYPIDAISDQLAALGLSRRIVGKTPDWHTAPAGYIVGTYPTRGREIQAWLGTRPEPPDAIAIVDDDADMGDLLPWLAQTNVERGITREALERLTALMSRPAPKREEAKP